MLRPLQVNEAVELIFEDVSAIPPMHTDESKVAQILRNFVANALKFTEQGSVRVSSRLSDDGQSVVFAVADTGIGIAPEHVELIFQEFGQVDSAVQRKFRGSGLGLPLVEGSGGAAGRKGVAGERSGEGIDVLRRDPAGHTGTRKRRSPSAPRRPCDLVIIDDEEVSRYLIRQTLGPGMEMVEATDGRVGDRAGAQSEAARHPAGSANAGDERVRSAARIEGRPGDARHPGGDRNVESFDRGGACYTRRSSDSRALEGSPFAAGWRLSEFETRSAIRH